MEILRNSIEIIWKELEIYRNFYENYIGFLAIIYKHRKLNEHSIHPTLIIYHHHNEFEHTTNHEAIIS